MSQKLTRRTFLSSAAVMTAAVGLAACGATPTATPVPPTATPVPPTATKAPAAAPTAAPAAPTAAPAAPTATKAPAAPTATTAAAAPTATPASKAVVGGKLVMAQWNPPATLYAINAASSYELFPIDIIFGSLATIDDKFNFIPRLASKWELAKDQVTYTITIDPKAKWHDGTPVTAEDVEFTVWAISHPDIATNRGDCVAFIKGIENSKRPAGVEKPEGLKVIDKQTLQVVTKTPIPQPYFLEKFGQQIYIIPKHLLKDVAPADFAKAPFWLKPVGAGPFKFKQYQTDQFLELTRNDDYVLGKPNLDTLILKVVPAASLVAQLEKGEIDMTAGGGIGEIPLDDWDRAKALKNVTSYEYDDNGYQYIEYNFRANKPTNNKLFRQALAYAINRKLMVDQLLKGTATVPNSPIIPTTPFFNQKTVGLYPYDPAKAKALLAEAKWDFNYVLKIMVPTGNKVRELSADIVQANLQDVGLKVSVEKMEFATLRARRVETTWDMGFIGWAGTIDPDVSSQFRTGGQYNNGQYTNTAMDALLDKGVATADPAERKKIYDDFQMMFADEWPILTLYWPRRTVAINKRVVGASHIMGTFNLCRNIHQWYVTDGK